MTSTGKPPLRLTESDTAGFFGARNAPGKPRLGCKLSVGTFTRDRAPTGPGKEGRRWPKKADADTPRRWLKGWLRGSPGPTPAEERGYRPGRCIGAWPIPASCTPSKLFVVR